MGIIYNKKIDIKNFFWKPRLVFTYAVKFFRDAFKDKNEERKYLEMTEYPEDFGYPRPQFARDSWLSLDGLWELSHSEGEDIPSDWDDSIRVPYAPQAKRSGVKKAVGDIFWYRRKFTLEDSFVKDTVLLHFGAVDQVAWVYVNKKQVGTHEGGYLPFSFDITEYLCEGENVIDVRIKDDLDMTYPYGKQSKKPSGMWYTQISGIWQSVWLESLPQKHVDSVRSKWCEDKKIMELTVSGTSDEYEITIFAPGTGDDPKQVLYTGRINNGANEIPIEDPVLWSPDEPNLYRYELRCDKDSVRSYFAIRTIEISRVNGVNCICLNHKPFFFHGVLDQGYFSDGIYTPVSYKYYEKDIRLMKELGFNTLRKHIKIEPARFYYDCDRLGMVVFQDMVNNGDYNYMRDTIMPTVAPFYAGHYKKDKHVKVNGRVKAFFVEHCEQTLEYLHEFPSIVYYTIFNEGWGQFDSDMVLDLLQDKEKDRIFDATSGWYKQKNSPVESIHCYFCRIPVSKWKKPAVVSECGGFSLLIPGNACFEKRAYGYGEIHSKEVLTKRVASMYEEEVIPHISMGISGCIYTQLCDVEEEINGLYTYDRKVCKVSKEVLKDIRNKIDQRMKEIFGDQR